MVSPAIIVNILSRADRKHDVNFTLCGTTQILVPSLVQEEKD